MTQMADPTTIHDVKNEALVHFMPDATLTASRWRTTDGEELYLYVVRNTYLEARTLSRDWLTNEEFGEWVKASLDLLDRELKKRNRKRSK